VARAIRSGTGYESRVICSGVCRCTERRRRRRRRRRRITMLRKLRIALVVTIMAVAVASSADSASALGFNRSGDFGLFGFGGP
jgi:predicted nucleic acid-binding Zn ribbon protein